MRRREGKCRTVCSCIVGSSLRDAFYLAYLGEPSVSLPPAAKFPENTRREGAKEPQVPSPYAPTTKHRPDGSIETKLSSPYDSSPTKHTIRSIDESMGGRLLWQERYQTSRPLQNARQRHRAARERTWQAKEISIMPLGYFSGVHIIAIATKVNHDLVLHMRYKSSTCATRVPHALRNHRPTPRTVDHGIVYRTRVRFPSSSQWIETRMQRHRT
jgi:hypothetical protein